MTQPNDDDIIPITRGQIKRLALAYFMAAGVEKDLAHGMAKSYADRFQSYGGTLDWGQSGYALSHEPLVINPTMKEPIQ